MKKLFTLSVVILITLSVLAQSPQKMNYQAVIRNSSNALVTSSPVGMRVSILQGSSTGTVVYTETQTPTTNANGLVSIEIGGGAGFDAINWANYTFFIKIETDPTGGTSYTITGTSQILSVPYSLYAKTAGNGSLWSQSGSNIYFNGGNVGIGTSSPSATLEINGGFGDRFAFYRYADNTLAVQTLLDDVPLSTYNTYGGDTENRLLLQPLVGNIGIGKLNPTSKLDVNGEINVNSNKIINVADPISDKDAANKAYVDNSAHHIGESYGGGIVFYVYDNGRHGLIAATADQSTGVVWTTAAFQSTVSNAVRDGINGGLANTERIIIQSGSGSYAAQLCANYQGGNYADWYLPSKYELNLLYLQKSVVGGFADNYYWSSTEISNNGAWYQHFGIGSQNLTNKNFAYYVRAVRGF
jgi:hypothetical protein